MAHLGVTIVLREVLLCAGVTSVSMHNNDTMIEPRSNRAALGEVGVALSEGSLITSSTVCGCTAHFSLWDTLGSSRFSGCARCKHQAFLVGLEPCCSCGAPYTVTAVGFQGPRSPLCSGVALALCPQQTWCCGVCQVAGRRRKTALTCSRNVPQRSQQCLYHKCPLKDMSPRGPCPSGCSTQKTHIAPKGHVPSHVWRCVQAAWFLTELSVFSHYAMIEKCWEKKWQDVPRVQGTL